MLMKVETHNHPTAISPFPGASTGAGGEIRDEGATGRGAKPKAGPDRLHGVEPAHAAALPQPWERRAVRQARRASRRALQIMIDGPLGGAAFNNEFGRPNLPATSAPTSRTSAARVRGYHKPIMIAGGLGNIDARAHAQEPTCRPARC